MSRYWGKGGHGYNEGTQRRHVTEGKGSGKKPWCFSSGPRDLLISHPTTFSWVRKGSSLCTISTNNFERPKQTVPQLR